MAVHQLCKNLQKDTECPLCLLETLKNPKSLPCLRSFCLVCLDKLAGLKRRQLQTTIKCPVCQTSFQIPESDTFNNLPNIDPNNDEIPVQEGFWFHGTVDRKSLPSLLKNNGDYLVRESTKVPGQIVLSTRFKGVLRHIIVQTSDDGLVRFEEQAFPSVKELLDYHVKNQVPVTKKCQAILVTPVKKKTDKWEMCRKDIVLQMRKSGIFSCGWKGVLKTSNMPVYVKVCEECVSEDDKKEMLAEAEILKRCDHLNIVKLIGMCTEEEPMFIVKEFMSGGDLLYYLRDKGAQLDSQKLIKFGVDAAAGMEYLQSKNCIHRDLAARNCLISSEDVLKISGFQMAREVEGVYDASNTNDWIPVRWTAPEVLIYFMYTTLSDVWSFGVLLWEIFTYGKQPYPGLSNKETRENVKAGYHMPSPAETPPPVCQIMKDCWNFHPEARPRFSEILRQLKQF